MRTACFSLTRLILLLLPFEDWSRHYCTEQGCRSLMIFISDALNYFALLCCMYAHVHVYQVQRVLSHNQIYLQHQLQS